MVDPLGNRDNQRDQISAEMEAFLSSGKSIEIIPNGKRTKEEPISKRWIAEDWPKWRDYA